MAHRRGALADCRPAPQTRVPVRRGEVTARRREPGSPAPRRRTFFADPFVQRNFTLDAVAAVVDGSTIESMLQERGAAPPVADSDLPSESDSDSDSEDGDDRVCLRADAATLLCEQLALADVVLLTKTDLLPDAAAVAAATAAIAGVNCRADVVRRCRPLRPSSSAAHPMRTLSDRGAAWCCGSGSGARSGGVLGGADAAAAAQFSLGRRRGGAPRPPSLRQRCARAQGGSRAPPPPPTPPPTLNLRRAG